MSSVNSVTLLGRLGHSPEIKKFENGSSVAKLSIATSEKWKDKETGEPREKTEWHKVEAFGRTAEIAAQYLSKGRQVYIEGRLQTDKWEKDGVKRSMTKIVVTRLVLVGDKSNGGGANGGSAEGKMPTAASQPPKDDDFDDDIPF